MKNALLALLVILVLSPLFSNTMAGKIYLEQINEVKFTNEPYDIVLFDNAYVITQGSVYAVSIKDPYNVTATELSEISGAKSIAFIGHFCYALYSNNSIGVFDFSKSPIAKRTSISINGSVKKIVIDKGYLYALNEDAGLQVYDVNVADFPVYKNTQIVPFNSNGLFVSNNKAYISSSTGNLSIIDVADKSTLQIVGSYSSGASFYEPFVDGITAYIPQGSTGVQVLDISKLPNPKWEFNLFGRKNSHQVVASNFYVWVADDKSIEGFYNDAPGSYYFAGNYKFKDKLNRIAVVDGKFIYAATNENKLKILRIDYKY